ncbi:MAG: hypothetical protein IKU29_01950 [Parabacteroides sp.]|nr:hypothetical protein [Parabacteroides sp.]
MSKIVRINNRYYDFGTTNESFLQTAAELKTLGIKNWYFMLEVKYPQIGVQDIDPYDPNISKENQGKIHIESKANIWFWLREVARVPAQGAPQPFRVGLTRASCAATWCYSHNIDFMLCQPRQTWKTTIVLLLITYAFIYELKNVSIPFMHLKESDTLRNAEMLRDYITTLPPYMNPWYGKKQLPGLKSLKYEEHGTSIKILSSADSEVKAKDKMRGMTLFVGMIDEWEYLNYISNVIAGAAPAMKSGRDIAAKTGGRACMMLLSTPGDLETQTGKEAQHMIDQTPPFSEQFYDFTEEEIKAHFDGVGHKNDDGTFEQITMLYIEFNYKQLRKDEAWRQYQYKEAAKTNKLAEYRRGVLLERFRGGDAVLFDQKDIDYIKENVKQWSYDIFLRKKFHLYCYKHEIKTFDLTSSTPYFDINIPYLIGVDVAAGGNGDNTAICVVHPYTLEVVAELQSPYIGLIDLMRIITDLAKIIPKGVFCVETNSVGKAIVDFVQETGLEHRFYYDPKMDFAKNAIEVKDPLEEAKVKAKKKQYIGTYVTGAVRNNMMDLLKRHVKDYKNLLCSKMLATDILNLVKGKNGKIQAADGEHDDMVMAYLHTLYVLYYGREISRFGIDKDKCSYERVNEVIQEYEEAVVEETINNMKPYDHPTMYEEQLLHDLTNPGFRGVDEYGYSYDKYSHTNNRNGLSHNEDYSDFTAEDYAFYTSVNSMLF